jgi:uncharacterized protein
MERRLTDPPYLAFPFRMEQGEPQLANRAGHIRGQIEQVLFTLAGERVFRPEFGAGVKALLFEPNHTAMWQVTRRRLLSSLAEALAGEVDPKSLEVEVSGEEEKLIIAISYTLAAIGQREQQRFTIGT